LTTIDCTKTAKQCDTVFAILSYRNESKERRTVTVPESLVIGRGSGQVAIKARVYVRRLVEKVSGDSLAWKGMAGHEFRSHQPAVDVHWHSCVRVFSILTRS
jgi:hypothetical protein